MTMWFSAPKTKTYTVTSPKRMGYTTDLTMNLPFGFDIPIAQINGWIADYDKRVDDYCQWLDSRAKTIDKQAAEILGLQEQLKWYAAEATEIWDELDAKAKHFEGDFAALTELHAHSVNQCEALAKELEETEDTLCSLYEDYEELVQLLQEVLEDPEEEDPKKQKKGTKKNGNKNQKGKPR